MERDAIDLGTLKVSKLFKKLFIPTVLGMLSIASVTIIDGIFVGNGIGSDGIAAVVICVPVLLFFIGFGLMLGMGCSVVTSIHLAKNKVKVARINVSQSFAFATIVLTIGSALIMIFPEKAGRLLGSSEALLPSVVDYLLWFVPSLLFDVWTVMALFIIRLDGSPKFAMWVSILTAVINIVLDWLFIFPFGWGVMGAAFASTISIVTGGILVMYYLFFKAKTLKFHPIKRSITSYKLALRNIGYHCQIGFPAFLGEATLATLTFLGNIAFMKYLGDDGVGAFGIACYYLPLVFMVGNAIAQSAQPIFSFNHGANNSDRVKSARKISFSTAIACGLFSTILFAFTPELLISAFLDLGTNAASLAVEGFPYFALGFICFTLNLSIIGYLQSVEKVKPSIFYALLRGFIFLIPAFIILPELLGSTGIWLAMPAAEILTTIIILIVSYFQKLKQVDLRTP